MTATGKSITISKLDAARRQLQTAVTLWFTGGDPVSTHALAYAAYENLHAVSKKRNPNRHDLLFDLAVIKEESRKEVNAMIKRHANFFKHGDRDAEAVVDFNPVLSETFILFAIKGLELCGESMSDEFLVFNNWMRIEIPLSRRGRRNRLVNSIPVENLAKLRALPEDDFFQ